MRITSHIYSGLLDAINNMHFQEQPGRGTDLQFIWDEFWLQDTAVIENIKFYRGMHYVGLIFAHHRNPLKFLCRNITAYPDKKKAVISAHYMRRQAAKDQRGTLMVSSQSFHLNMN